MEGESVSRYGSIITRLTLVVTGILVTAVLVVGSLALLGQYRQLRLALTTKGTTLVQFMAQVAPLSILSLNFVEMNNDTKKVVLTDDEAVYAVILNEQRIPLVYFLKDDDPLVTDEMRSFAKNRQPLAAIESMKGSGRILEVTAPIMAGERRIGSAILGFSTDKMRGALLMQVALLSTIVAAIIAASLLLLRVVLRRILHPVQVLTAAATRISTGDLNVELAGTEQPDELGVLSRAFASMAGQLHGLIAGLEQRERDLRGLTLFQRTILDNAAYGIIATSPDGIVSSFNGAAERLLGYSASEVVGKLTAVYWHDPEEVAQRAQRLSAELGDTVEPGFEVFASRPRRNLTEEGEWTFIRKDGNRVPVLLSVTALRDEQGGISGFVGLTYDLTERNRAEERRRESDARYRCMVDTAIEGICSLGPDGSITLVNARMAEMLGYPEEEMLGRQLTEFMFEEDVADQLARMENRRRGLSESYERCFRRKNGETVWTLASAATILDDKQQFQGSFGMFSDITERKQAEEELRRLKDELEQRVKERTAELASKNEELARMNKLFIGRELRMVELKGRIRELEQATGAVSEYAEDDKV